MDIADWKLVATSVKHYQIVTFDIFLAGEAGFEPTLTVLETAVLPLYYSPKKVGDLFVWSPTCYLILRLVNEFSYLTSTYCSTTLTDCELETLVDRYWINEVNSDCYVVTRHYHLYTLWK